MFSPTGTSIGWLQKAVYLSSLLVRDQGCQGLVHPRSLQERQVMSLLAMLFTAQARRVLLPTFCCALEAD